MLEIDIKSRTFQAADGTHLPAIKDLSFSLSNQSFSCIVGPSGCGKTSTLRIIMGLDTDYEGSIKLVGGDRVAAVFQEPRLLPWRTVRQNVELGLPPEITKDNDIDSLFTELGLTEHQHFFPSELSLGLARRVAIARAFATQPALLILDEPFVSLDDETAERLRTLLQSVWRARPTTVLMVTHNVREAAELADSILVFSERPTRVLETITPDFKPGDRVAGEIDRIAAEINLKKRSPESGSV